MVPELCLSALLPLRIRGNGKRVQVILLTFLTYNSMNNSCKPYRWSKFITVHRVGTFTLKLNLEVQRFIIEYYLHI